tara:strand:- start:287 stop:784 length:498 start_codon:yes stop_codon:yes gene_type:complete
MSKIHLKNVRLSFASIFHRAVFNGDEGKYEATFLIPKTDEATKEALDEAIADALKDAKVKVPSDKSCLKDGDDSEYDGYADHWSFKAANNKRPTIIDRDKTPLVEEDGKPYSGCYVNAVVDIWVQNNSYGKRVNANLHGVQFVKDAQSFGSGGTPDATDEFDDLD